MYPISLSTQRAVSDCASALSAPAHCGLRIFSALGEGVRTVRVRDGTHHHPFATEQDTSVCT